MKESKRSPWAVTYLRTHDQDALTEGKLKAKLYCDCRKCRYNGIDLVLNRRCFVWTGRLREGVHVLGVLSASENSGRTKTSSVEQYAAGRYICSMQGREPNSSKWKLALKVYRFYFFGGKIGLSAMENKFGWERKKEAPEVMEFSWRKPQPERGKGEGRASSRIAAPNSGCPQRSIADNRTPSSTSYPRCLKLSNRFIQMITRSNYIPEYLVLFDLYSLHRRFFFVVGLHFRFGVTAWIEAAKPWRMHRCPSFHITALWSKEWKIGDAGEIEARNRQKRKRRRWWRWWERNRGTNSKSSQVSSKARAAPSGAANRIDAREEIKKNMTLYYGEIKWVRIRQPAMKVGSSFVGRRNLSNDGWFVGLRWWK